MMTPKLLERAVDEATADLAERSPEDLARALIEAKTEVRLLETLVQDAYYEGMSDGIASNVTPRTMWSLSKAKRKLERIKAGLA